MLCFCCIAKWFSYIYIYILFHILFHYGLSQGSEYTFGVCVCTQSHPTLCDPMGCSLPGSSVHGILQARILEWVAMSFSRDLPDPEIEPLSLASPALAGSFFTWEAKVLLVVKNPATSAGDKRDMGSVPGPGRSPVGGHDSPLQYSSWRIPWTEEPGGLQPMIHSELDRTGETEYAAHTVNIVPCCPGPCCFSVLCIIVCVC